jgi:phosphoribosylaminoimidazolecarboxamide formyltransferase/IMP cyclohydrolase
MTIARALISVYDKSGLVGFARVLATQNVEIISTGGTAKLLREAGLPVRDVAKLTGWPEMLGGRVKTLHPKIHGGILFRRDVAEDVKQSAEHDIGPIDLVVVNLYPFPATARKAGVTAEDLIENIDIGGPAMVRAAAKNFGSVTVVTDPADYPAIATEISTTREVSPATRLRLARKAFGLTARYDGDVATELERLRQADGGLTVQDGERWPERIHFAFERRQTLRYGENPHQSAALYADSGEPPSGIAGARQIQGKELSYNNLVDLDSAWKLVREFSKPAAIIVKHNNPCGAAEHATQVEAYLQALACDPVSAFGGVMAFNCPLDKDTADEVAKLFVECIAAPGYAPEALAALGSKKNLRLLEVPGAAQGAAEDDKPELKRISGGVLLQDADSETLPATDLKVVTQRAPSDAEWSALIFAWTVCKHVKSNAIVFARDGATLGIGAGQMSRVDSVKIAVMKAQSPLANSVVASDAFFPFADGVEEAAKAGATAVIQPGGSVRDTDVIAAAEAAGMAMVFTGMRHFRH